MDRRQVDERISELCTVLDERAARWQRRLWQLALPLAVPAALAMPVALGACAEHETDAGDLACEDGLDNDGDGDTDCEDDDCLGEPPCSVDLYGAPF